LVVLPPGEHNRKYWHNIGGGLGSLGALLWFVVVCRLDRRSVCTSVDC